MRERIRGGRKEQGRGSSVGSDGGVAGRTEAGRRLQALWLVDREEWLVGSVATSRRGRWWLLIWSGGDPEEEEGGQGRIPRNMREWVAAQGGIGFG